MKTFWGLIGSALILLCSGAVFFESFSYDIRDRFWPQGISVLIAILCIPLIAGQLKKRSQDSRKDEKNDLAHHLVWFAILLITLYLFLAEWLGYFFCTTLLMLALLLVFGERSKIMLTVLPVGSMLVIYGVFYLFLRIPLPTGLLF